MDNIKLLSEKQFEFIHNAEATHNIAHGPIRSGKTVGSLFKFMLEVDKCPDSQIWMVGHTSDSIFDNAIRLLLEPKQPTDPFAIFRPFLKWSGGTTRNLYFKDKVISTLGAKNEGMLGVFMGKTFSLCYADEITLYPDNIIDAMASRLSNSYSKLYATCNPNHPEHKIKKWIDWAKEGDKRYYELQFMLDDNPFLEEAYKDGLKKSLSGLFFKRNYLGLWALAEGAIFDFFDTSMHVIKKPPRAAHYFICGIDYGTNHKFACTIVGINTGTTPTDGVQKWAEAEYVWDCSIMGVQKTASEYAEEVVKFITPYGIQAVYVDPSALHFKLELQKRGIHCREADNDVENGIIQLGSEMKSGTLQITRNCPELIKEIQSYVWDSKKAKLGEDAPVKQNDDCIDSLRYAIRSHKPAKINPANHNPHDYKQTRFSNFKRAF